MKNIIFVLAAIIFFYSCSASKETSSSSQISAKEKKLAEQIMIKKAIESRKYIVKVDRIYFSKGNIAELQPDNNFIIINGELASVSLPYMGHSFGARPISGINFDGQTTRYEMKSDEQKGIFHVNMNVARGGQSFNIFLTVGTGGYCSFSMNNLYLETVSYKGRLVPIPSSADQQNDDQVRM